jgi:ubiquitin carboxyl-terminal hydrolase L5
MCTDRCRWQVNGRLIELDGLKPGPIDHGVCTKDDGLGKSRTVIESRIA